MLSVVIPSYKGQALLKDSLPHLYKALEKISAYEVIVIDNGSQDSTIAFLKHHYPDIRVKELETNFGFTKAVNTAIGMAKGAFVLILNNDCHVREDAIAILLAFAKKHPHLVATQPVVEGFDGSLENIGYVVNLKKGKAEAVIDKNLIPDFDNATMWDSGFMYGLSGACLLVRRDIFKKIGLFDEAFHSYLEDVDFFIRLAISGYSYAPCLGSCVLHKHMSTSLGMKGYKQWHDMTNWVRIIRKHYPMSFLFRHAGTLAIERLRNLSGWLKSYRQV